MQSDGEKQDTRQNTGKETLTDGPTRSEGATELDEHPDNAREGLPSAEPPNVVGLERNIIEGEGDEGEM
jgi:hypothetical protein